MSEPRRLFEDPDAPAELRAALSAERALSASYEPAELGARVAQALASGAPVGAGALGSSWWLGPKALIVTAAVSAALGAGGHALYVATTASPPAPLVQAPVPVAPVPPTELAPPPAAPARPEHAAPSPSRAPRAPGALADELRLYERGEAALLEGHYEVAARELERYLGEFPKGTLRAEAELGLVQALAKSGRCDRAEARVKRAPPGAHREALAAAAARCGAGR